MCPKKIAPIYSGYARRKRDNEMKDESIKYCIKFARSFFVADVNEADKELDAMQARIEKLEALQTIAEDANTWLIKNKLGGTAHQKSLAEALYALKSDEMTFEITNITNQIIYEIETLRLNQRAVADTCSIAIVQGGGDWPKINAAIVKRWSLSARERVLTMAWKIVEGAK